VQIERLFGLGRVKDGPHETYRVVIDWDLEPGETVEQAEELAADQLYKMAYRERKRRWAFSEKIKKEDAARFKQQQEAKTAPPVYATAAFPEAGKPRG